MHTQVENPGKGVAQVFAKNPAGGAQWEKSNKFVPLGKIRKIIFSHQIKFVGLIP